MMSMTFETSSSVTLLFDFWNVHGAAGMVLSVLVVFLLTLFYELLKVWRIWLSRRFKKTTAPLSDGTSVLESSPSESSLTPIASVTQPTTGTSSRNSLQLHLVQTALHVLQVALGYMLMLCVMSYNTWIFIAVIAGSVLGYFILFPLLGHM